MVQKSLLSAALGLAVGVSAASNTTCTPCNDLASALPGQVFTPDAPTYDSAIKAYPFLQLRLHPTCIVRPKSAKDVSVALGVLRQNNQTRFAVKGGGHNANAGFNNIDNGITIDMGDVNKVEVARGDKTIRVGAGSLWQNVYDVAEKRNLTAIGGRIGVVGTAGFLTGGGVGFYSPEHGWASDQVVNFEIVLASGEIVNANATSRDDLYAALKGGQSNFGIVTRFDLKAYPARKIYGGRIVFAPQAAEDVLNAYTNFKTAANFDTNVAGWTTISYNHSTGLFNPVAIMWNTNPELKRSAALDSIIAIKPQLSNGMVEAPITEHTRNASRQVTAAPRRNIWATTSFYVSPTIVKKVHALWKGRIASICETYADANPLAQLTFQALPDSPRNGSSPNSMGLAANTIPGKKMLFLQVVFTYDGASADYGFETALKNLIEVVEDLTMDEGVYHPYKYLNFASWWQDPFGSYGRDQKRKLRDVARKYDPAQVFQRQLAGGFKLL